MFFLCAVLSLFLFIGERSVSAEEFLVTSEEILDAPNDDRDRLEKL